MKTPFFAQMLFARHWIPTLLLLLSPALVAATAKKATTTTAAAYKGAIVVDAATGRVLYEDRADTITPPASMAKLMTFAVVHDRLIAGTLQLSTPVKITAEDARMGGTQVFLDSRETFPVEELLHAMMIQSANDASHALAHAAAGTVPAFVELMNAKAKALGMNNTTFRTPHGLPPVTRKLTDGDLTTPRDFALLSRYLLQHTNVTQYSSVRTRDFGASRANGPQRMKNHNNLLGKVDGVDGLKTGYTEGAGYCLSATAQRQGRRVIAVIMGSFGPNGQKDLGKARDMKAIELIEKGFSALPPGSAAPVAAAPAPASTPAAKPAAVPAPAATLTPAAASTAPSFSPVVPAPRQPATAKPAAQPTATIEPIIKFSVPKK